MLEVKELSKNPLPLDHEKSFHSTCSNDLVRFRSVASAVQWPLTITWDAKFNLTSPGFPLYCKAVLTSSAIITPCWVQLTHTHLQYVLLFSDFATYSMGDSLKECQSKTIKYVI